MKRQERISSRLRQPDRSGLCDTRRPTRPGERESCGLAIPQIPLQLKNRLPSPSRRRSASCAITEALDDARDPFAVEVFARDHDDAAPAEIVGGRKNAAVPEHHDRLLAGSGDAIEVIEALGL